LQALSQPPEAIGRYLTEQIRRQLPDHEVMSIGLTYHEILKFASRGYCEVTSPPGFSDDDYLYWHMPTVTKYPLVAWWLIQFQGQQLEYLQYSITEGMHRSTQTVMASPDVGTAETFLARCKEFNSILEGAVLVFSEGCWRKDEDLFHDIQNSTRDNLILAPDLAETIWSDVQNWLDSRELYDQHAIPWKRGIILTGPPGNGKTHTIKALINHFEINALYVRGFSERYGSESANITKVFEKARESAPCFLILEDLDSLVNPKNRSFFLNELDGFTRNRGIFIIASANDPGKLDAALVNRPSRFDRKYLFDLPAVAERQRYLEFLSRSLADELQLDADEAARVADATEGFSFAYLKELVLSSMMAWISDGRRASFAGVMQANAVFLLSQMVADPVPTPEVFSESDDDDEE